jgi:hypothetical protein
MDYLRGNATANASGIYVICRYLSGIEGGLAESDLKRSLRAFHSSMGGTGEQGSALLDSSLVVAREIGLLNRCTNSSHLVVDSILVEGLSAGETWPWFRGHLLDRMVAHALASAAVDGKVPDLILGLTWLQQLSPLKPPLLDWNSGPYTLVRQYGMQEILSTEEQWRAFQRWAVALGLARRCDQPNARVLIPDAGIAVSDRLNQLPSTASAREWIAALLACLPIVGDPSLTDRLPDSSSSWSNLPPGLVLGLLKLEKNDVLKLEPSDDSSDVVAIGLGPSIRQIGRVSVGEQR